MLIGDSYHVTSTRRWNFKRTLVLRSLLLLMAVAIPPTMTVRSISPQVHLAAPSTNRKWTILPCLTHSCFEPTVNHCYKQ